MPGNRGKASPENHLLDHSALPLTSLFCPSSSYFFMPGFPAPAPKKQPKPKPRQQQEWKVISLPPLRGCFIPPETDNLRPTASTFKRPANQDNSRWYTEKMRPFY